MECVDLAVLSPQEFREHCAKIKSLEREGSVATEDYPAPPHHGMSYEVDPVPPSPRGVQESPDSGTPSALRRSSSRTPSVGQLFRTFSQGIHPQEIAIFTPTSRSMQPRTPRTRAQPRDRSPGQTGGNLSLEEVSALQRSQFAPAPAGSPRRFVQNEDALHLHMLGPQSPHGVSPLRVLSVVQHLCLPPAVSSRLHRCSCNSSLHMQLRKQKGQIPPPVGRMWHTCRVCTRPWFAMVSSTRTRRLLSLAGVPCSCGGTPSCRRRVVYFFSPRCHATRGPCVLCGRGRHFRGCYSHPQSKRVSTALEVVKERWSAPLPPT